MQYKIRKFPETPNPQTVIMDVTTLQVCKYDKSFPGNLRPISTPAPASDLRKIAQENHVTLVIIYDSRFPRKGFDVADDNAWKKVEKLLK